MPRALTSQGDSRHQLKVTHHVLHLVGDVQCQVCRRAAGAPGDVTEQRPQAGHPVLPIEQVLHALQPMQSIRRDILDTRKRGVNCQRDRNALLFCLTSSVRGGKNSNEKKGLPVAATSLILSASFMAARQGGDRCANQGATA